MKKKYVRILVIALLLIGVAAVYAYSEYNRGHKDVSGQKADVTIAATDLFSEFSADENAANGKYLDKTIAVSGVVKSVDKDESGLHTIQLESGDMMGNVSCQMDERHNEKAAAIKAGETIAVKGTCTGILMDVVLIRCAIDK